jgi:hypothetical protein
MRTLFKIILDFCEYEKPLKTLFDLKFVDVLAEIHKVMEKCIEKGLVPESQKFVSSFLCTLYNICTTEIGKPILGDKFLFSFIKSSTLESIPSFCRRQMAENVSMLLKDSKHNKDLFFSKRNHISVL